MELIVLISKGKGSWSQAIGLIKRGKWDKIIVIGDDYSKKTFYSLGIEKKFEFIKVNLNKNIMELIEEFKEKLKNKVKGIEIGLNIASGDGKEHMALISALLSLPVGIKFAILTREGIKLI